MRFQDILGACTLAFASPSLAEHIPANHYLWGPDGPAGNHLQRRASSTVAASATSTKVADSTCTNGPLTRSCWSNGYSVATDFDAKWPTTGVTRSYSLELTNGTCNQDGHSSKPCQLFNGVYPAPVITANWGDYIQVTLKNSLAGNGTGIHWHGIRQLHSGSYDGVPGVTECPLAPGDTKVYTFQATQFGTTWYHSHFSAQYGEGAFGPLVINGPSSANYDIDLGPYVINDYYYQTAYQIGSLSYSSLQNFQAGPPADTILINGTNVNSASGSTGGAYNNVKIKKGKKYLLRLINASLDNQIRVSLDNHAFQVIRADMVPIKPYVAEWLLLGIGQRYDVVVSANQTEGNYWFRADAAADCASANNFYGRSIFTYDTVTTATPTNSTGFTEPTVCQDESARGLVPWVTNTIDKDTFLSQVGSLDVDVDVEQVATNGKNIVFWGVNVSAINVDWEQPTLEYVKQGNTSYPTSLNLIEIPNQNTWSYWIIQETPGTAVPIPHPIHLHGHDFYYLGQGTGTFNINSDPNSLTWNNPMRRDTALLPANGWLAIAFPMDNPGAWLMHCHIAWHVSEGFAVQFLESKSDAQFPKPDDAWEKTCTNWDNYYKNPLYFKDDSGLKRGLPALERRS